MAVTLLTFVNSYTGIIYFIVIFYFGYIFSIWVAIGRLFSSTDSLQELSESSRNLMKARKLSK